MPNDVSCSLCWATQFQTVLTSVYSQDESRCNVNSGSVKMCVFPNVLPGEESEA